MARKVEGLREGVPGVGKLKNRALKTLKGLRKGVLGAKRLRKRVSEVGGPREEAPGVEELLFWLLSTSWSSSAS